MAKVTILLEKGDVFYFQGGHGIVIKEGEPGSGDALLLKGKSGRTGRTIERGAIPSDAKPLEHGVIEYEIRFALQAVAAAL